MTLQEKNENEKLFKTIPCGIEYLNETVGLSLTDNYFYQFLFLNETIEVIRYEQNQRLSKNNNNEYKLNLIDGQMLANGLKDLVHELITEYITNIFKLEGNDYNGKLKKSNDELSIIAMAYTINKHEQKRFICCKTNDQIEYYIGNYNEELSMGFVLGEIAATGKKYILSLLSNQSDGMIVITYSENSYEITIFKLKEDIFFVNDHEWKITLVVDANYNFLQQFNGKPNIVQEHKFNSSFEKIFGKQKFTYGFVDDDKIYLFSNQNEKVIAFSSNFTGNNEIDSKQKYRFKFQSYKDFFH
ncbi:hypothetical protein DERP_004281 [Dermatophagoides pteronyssinus]|uniref:Uncharacterized protein n=1 Tax=Dermatophagoides pteronyssinus TaxID=6956 RepID=A0ABQ8J8N3_DERPT|nr:hypothetical protein DERP_004281 [Dermatophagoides pteronyssinus]